MIQDIIRKKRGGEKLTEQEISSAVSAYVSGEVPDYQMSALLMAVFLKGLDPAETLRLTKAMADSGDRIDLSGVPGVKVDKHSTGGVGDGTSLVVAPLVASLGVPVPMIAGRGLGHTGGTIDKLEAIPGFNANLTEEQYKDALSLVGAVITGQTERVAPADRKLYALRDVTCTVECVPLIAASIMSKKLAEGCDALLLDVKTGSGAFMKSAAEAEKLARAMLSIGKGAGLRMAAVITDMDAPLGKAVGNSLEVIQAVETLKGGGPDDFRELSLELGARMLLLSGKYKDAKKARTDLAANLSNGAALKKFSEMVSAQGGNVSFIGDPWNRLQVSGRRTEARAQASGYIRSMDTAEIGTASAMLGAGRIRKEDRVDHGAGIMLAKKTGDRVEKGETIAVLFAGTGSDAQAAERRFSAAVRIGKAKPPKRKLIIKEIRA